MRRSQRVPTSLRIHHIGLRGAGDATLLVVRSGADSAIVWSLLVDGGLQGESPTALLPALRRVLGSQTLTGIVATHYDRDHLGGLVDVLDGSAFVDESTVILDRGTPTTILGWETSDKGRGAKRQRVDRFTYREAGTQVRQRYLALVPQIMDRTPTYVPASPIRSTAAVITKAARTKPPKAQDPTTWAFPDGNQTPFGQKGFCAPGWLIDTQGTAERLNAPLAKLTPSISVTILAANRVTRRTNQPPLEVPFQPPPGLSEEELLASEENQGCVALLVSFGSFNYYLPGDLEQPQEDKLVTGNGWLTKRRLHVMKLSHHGAITASSDLFLSSAQPVVAIASNGIDNKNKHPNLGGLSGGAIGRLDADAWAGTANTLVSYFATGWFYGDDLRGHVDVPTLYDGGSTWRARVAGSARAITPGEVVVSIDDTGASATKPIFKVSWRDAYLEATRTETYGGYR